MKTRFLRLIIVFFTIASFSQNTYNAMNNTPRAQVNLPMEKVYVHINSANLFVGESFYYKVYTTTPKNNLLSPFSKVAYIRLVGSNDNTIFYQKINLTDGQGYGDFLIPTEVPSGRYKLIAYTKMSLKQAQNNVFVTDVSIINPYTPSNPDLVTIVESNTGIMEANPKETTTQDFQINLAKQNFGKREQVNIQLTVSNENVLGDYSISVNKLENISPVYRPDILNSAAHQKTLPLKNNIPFLPELRGELISGKISSTNSEASVRNQPIALSIPEENFVLKVGTTNNEGRFYINNDERYFSSTAYLQVLNNHSAHYEFTMDESPAIDFSSLTFEKLTLSEDFKEHIVDRSIKNQVENSYLSVKQTVPKAIDKPFFFGNNYTVTNLDEFTRFPTLHETFTEIVNNVWFERIGRDGYQVRVRSQGFDLRSPFPALLMVDGLLIQDHSLLYNYNAFNIQRIRVVRDKYFYGGKIFQGIVSIETIEKNYHQTTQLPELNEIELFRPEPAKHYFKADYSQNAGALKNIPDFRKQLLWNPLLNIHSLDTTVDFYTSDEAGTFEIVIEGITHDGKAVKATRKFTVN